MRSIKFRIWHKPTNQFVRCHPVWDDEKYTDLGLLSLTSDGELIFETKYDGFQRLSSNEVDDFIVQQYTGLKDKNEVEVYEGDIADWCEDSYIDEGTQPATIVWHELEGWKCTWYTEDRSELCTEPLYFYENHRYFEVIGNIFEGVKK